MATGRAQEVPDQGWAWVVLLAVVLSQGITFGFPSCIVVFYTDIQASFQASNSETSWFPSIVTAVLHAGESAVGGSWRHGHWSGPRGPGPGLGLGGAAGSRAVPGNDLWLPIMYCRLLHGHPSLLPGQQQ
ncbi:monocarboxylate transporter 13-like [Pleurodeles waltl]